RWCDRVRSQVAAANAALRPTGACRVPPAEPEPPGDATLPSCDIVIPVYEGAGYVRDLLRSIDQFTDAAVTPFHLWLVDDGSDPNTYARLQALVQGRADATLVRRDANRGFVESTNAGIALGSAPLVVVLN